MAMVTSPPKPEDVHAPRQRVLLWLREGIEQGLLRRGMTLPSERVIATQLNVSRETVRAALNDAGSDGLVESAEGGRRRVAAGTAAQSSFMSRVVAILSDSPLPSRGVAPTNESGYFKSIVAPVVEAAGLHPLGLSADRLDQVAMSRLAGDPPRGVLVVDDPAAHARVPEVLAALPASVPVVARVWSGEELNLGGRLDRVISEHEAGGATLARWLIERGCRRILRLWQTDVPSRVWLKARDRGIERSVREAGLPVLKPLIVTPVHLALQARDVDAVTAESQFHFRARTLAGYLADHLLDPAARVDAIMVITDEHAYEVAAALRILRVDPAREVTIAGYDNHGSVVPGARFEEVGPAVTMDKQPHEFSRVMVDLLRQRIAGELPNEPQVIRCPHRLVEIRR